MRSRPSPVSSFEVYPCGRGLLLKAQVIHQLFDCKEHANERRFHGYILHSALAERLVQRSVMRRFLFDLSASSCENFSGQPRR